MKTNEYIPIKDCKDGYLYIIHARNGLVGIYQEENNYFWLSRRKFKDKFLYPEIHWDADENFGTVKPLKEVCKAPIFDNEQDKLNYLDEKTKELRKEREKIISDLISN